MKEKPKPKARASPWLFGGITAVCKFHLCHLVGFTECISTLVSLCISNSAISRGNTRCEK